jgi:DNA-binding transcriptional LysR family regulator
MDWDRLKVFYAVAQAGSFSRAGEVLHLSQSAVSRQVAALETSLTVSLFHRHARGLVLSEQGELLFRTVEDVHRQLAAAEHAVQDSRQRPSGPLVITTTVEFGCSWVVPRLKHFHTLYPEITVQMVLEDREFDLHLREADAAIRMFPSRHPDLIQTPLTRMRYGIYASERYLQECGTPKRVEDLPQHRLVMHGPGIRELITHHNWLLNLEGMQGHSPVLQVNNYYGMSRAVRAGIGIALLPEYLTRNQNQLVALFPDAPIPEAQVYFVYPMEAKHSRRIQCFRDFLVEEMRGGV